MHSRDKGRAGLRNPATLTTSQRRGGDGDDDDLSAHICSYEILSSHHVGHHDPTPNHLKNMKSN